MEKEFRVESKRKVKLTKREMDNILSINPSYKKVIKSVYFDNYDLPCPVRVDILTTNNSTESVVLRKARHGYIRKEAKVIEILNQINLPVPRMLYKPFKNEKNEWVAVYSLLPGKNLQKLSMGSKKELSKAKNLLLEGINFLILSTDYIKKHNVSKTLPSYPLDLELRNVIKKNPWATQKIFRSAVAKLKPLVKNIRTPLVFSNGDYQPGNFLAEKGKISGLLDFESPSFQDPIMGIVKYPIYDLFPLSRTNLVKLFLKENGFSERDFSIRLALGSLKILKKEIPVSGGNKNTRRYRKRVLKILEDSLNRIK